MGLQLQISSRFPDFLLSEKEAMSPPLTFQMEGFSLPISSGGEKVSVAEIGLKTM